MLINIKYIFFRFYPLVISKSVFKIFYIHTGHNDFCFLWITNKNILDLLFIKIIKNKLKNKVI